MQVDLKIMQVMYDNQFFKGLEFVCKMYEEQTESEPTQRNGLLS